MLDLLEDTAKLKTLPRSLATLECNLKERFPLMKIRRKQIPLVQEKLPSMTPQQKNLFSKLPPSDWLYLFDLLSLFASILSSLIFLAKMHLRMVEFVDEASELWHSQSWSVFIRFCSCEFAYYTSGQPIFPSNIVRYRCLESECRCHIKLAEYHFGRVYAIGRDKTKTTLKYGQKTIQVQVLWQPDQISDDFEVAISSLELGMRSEELLVVENLLISVSEGHIIEHQAGVMLDY